MLVLYMDPERSSRVSPTTGYRQNILEPDRQGKYATKGGSDSDSRGETTAHAQQHCRQEQRSLMVAFSQIG